MLNWALPVRLENIEEPDRFDVHVRLGPLDGVARPRLGDDIHDEVETILREQALYECRVGEVAADEGEAPLSSASATTRRRASLMPRS